MTKRDNHYEQAFEERLRQWRTPYVAVDETRRTLLGNGSLKSLDFIVSPGHGQSWLVDVKGRRFGARGGRQLWKNWSTTDDLESLAQWQELFGPSFGGLLVFAYNIVGDLAPLPPEQLFVFRGALYAFVGVTLEHYASWARLISPKWSTVAMPKERFVELAAPIEQFFLPQSSAQSRPKTSLEHAPSTG